MAEPMRIDIDPPHFDSNGAPNPEIFEQKPTPSPRLEHQPQIFGQKPTPTEPLVNAGPIQKGGPIATSAGAPKMPVSPIKSTAPPLQALHPDIADLKHSTRSRASSNASDTSYLSSRPSSIRTTSSGGHSAYAFDASDISHTTTASADWEAAAAVAATQVATEEPGIIGLQHDPVNKCLVLPPQTLHIYILSLTNKDHLITLDDKKTVLYSSNAHQWSSTFGSGTADVELRRGGQTAPIVASANIRRTGPSEISFFNLHTFTQAETKKAVGTTTLERDAKLGIKYTTKHPLTQEECTWKSTHTGTSFFSHGNLKLEDRNGELLARFTSSAYKSVSKAGKLEILKPLREDSLDWVVVTCLTMIEKERRRRKGKNAGIAGASAS